VVMPLCECKLRWRIGQAWLTLKFHN
jgi:hypothetical protein